MPLPISRTFRIALALCLVAGSTIESGSSSAGREDQEACGPDPPQEDEDAEALAASTLLLQSSALHSRAPVHSGRTALRLAVLRSVLGSPESPLSKVMGEVLASQSKPGSDPFWSATHDKIRDLTLQEPVAANFVRLCQSGDFARYNRTGCAPNAEGSIVVNGSQADAYFCGSPAVDWVSFKYPVNSICTAEPGSAYGPEGQCGKQSKKQLVLNYASTVPHWKDDIFLVNVPSVDCILGLGDCDIYYCQHCPGRCS
mmetsp:Transcript_58558/g.117210  ORF Transcript_58558/g.117210 Transcript_58558/m.117210 type:complete len:256 (+) Transcript_58558:89-856(+)